ncbi:hypothetical protein Ocin01_06209 [Orchesella cincta]|uniref:Multifunctional methyltransferase subunit TRM112-like protein n=1 Tax=Orchesella cincta TaxID=48709 RepID=A0A1D2N659_ORCCI|nr:hypothetical protein Ocin01_06209 [Orchesella cincta]
MKLFTHNMLTSKMIKNVKVGYPLKLHAAEVKVTPSEFRSTYVSRMLPKIDWGVLYEATQSIGQAEAIPQSLADDYEKNEDFLRKAHHALFEIEVINGEMICPETGRKFPIKDGIPNMLVNEDEVN